MEVGIGNTHTEFRDSSVGRSWRLFVFSSGQTTVKVQFFYWRKMPWHHLNFEVNKSQGMVNKCLETVVKV